MTAVAYDLEFIEYRLGRGRPRYTIELISIGLAADDGRSYYAANRDMPIRRIRRHPWLMEHVVPHLPKGRGDARPAMGRHALVNYADPAVKPLSVIASQVAAFLQATPDLELWADYGAYDHVRLCWLWGLMPDLPAGIPMFTHDIQQEAHHQGLSPEALPAQPDGHHHPLADAQHVLHLYHWIGHGAR